MQIKNNLDNIRTTICKTFQDKNESDVTVVAVSKHHPVEEIMEAYQAGQRIFGENRVQELLPKIEATSHIADIKWHLIGHLQKNKVRQIVGKVDLIQSVDSIELANEIEKRAALSDCNVNILLQVNVAHEEQKHGIEFDEIDDFLSQRGQWPHLYIKGLMFIAPNLENKEDLKPYFLKLKQKFDSLKSMEDAHLKMEWLSMGMSGDYLTAIKYGANMVRIGSAIFNTK